MDELIDRLQIEISSDASEASDGLTKLVNTLNTIKAAVTPASESFRQLRDTIDGLNKSAVYMNLEPMRDALVKLADASKGINEIDFSGIVEIGNVFTTLTNMFEGADMEIGARLLQFTQQLKWGMVELSGVGNSIDEGAMQKLTGVGNTLRTLARAVEFSGVDTNGLPSLAQAISSAAPMLIEAGNMIDVATLEKMQDFSYIIPNVLDAFKRASSGGGQGIDATVSSLHSLSEALANMNSVALPSAQNLMNLRSALAAFSGLRSTFDTAGLKAGISGIAKAAKAISEDEVELLKALGSALSGVYKSFQSMVGLSANDADNFSAAISQIMDACRQINESDLARLNSLQGALSELRQAGGIGGLIRQSSQGSSGSSGGGSRGGFVGSGFASSALAELKNVFGTIRRGVSAELDSLGNIVKMRFSGIGESIRGIGGAMDWFKGRISLSNTALGSFLSGLARIAKYRLLRTIIKGFTSGATEGLENLARASEEANETLTRLSTATLLLKNSMGGTLYSALATAMDWITALADAAARAMDILSQFFAILGGRNTYMKAVSYTQDYVDSTNDATSALSGLKQELMGFEEINALTPDRSRSGAGGGLDEPDYGGMFVEAPVSKWLQDMVDSGDFTKFGDTIAEKINEALSGISWDGIKSGATKLVRSFTTALNGFFAKIDGKVFGRTIGEILNTAALFVGKFWSDTNWAQIGTRVYESIMSALETIDPKLFAEAIVGKLNAAALFLDNLLPKNKKDWLLIANRITEFITYALKYINWDSISSAAKKLSDTMSNVLNNFFEGMDPNLIGESIAKAINIGATTVGDFFEQTKWDMIGTRAKEMLLTAIENIDADALASSIIGRINAAIALVSGFLPDEPEELDTIADKFTGFIDSALDDLNWEDIRATAGRVATTLSGLLNRLFRRMDAKKFGDAISGAINSATEFIGKFWTETDWDVAGDKVKESLEDALEKIDSDALGNAIMGRFKSAITFLAKLLPSTYAEWKTIADKVSGLINFAIKNIPADAIGNIISSVIMGGISFIKSLGDGHTLTNIATAIRTTLESAFENFTEEDAKAALKSVIDDIKEALRVLLTLDVDINGITFSAVGLIISGFAIFNAIKGKLGSVMSNPSFNGSLIFGGIAFGFTAGVQALKVIEDLKAGNDISKDDICGIIQNAMLGVGFTIFGTGHLKGGLVALGIGMGLNAAIELIDIAKGAYDGEAVDWTQVAGALGSALQAAGLAIAGTISLSGGFIVFGLGIALKPVIEKIFEIQDAATSAYQNAFGDKWQELFNSVFEMKSWRDMYSLLLDISKLDIDVTEYYDVLTVMSEFGGYDYDGTATDIDGMQLALSKLFREFAEANKTGTTWAEFIDEILNGTYETTTSLGEATTATSQYIDTTSGVSHSLGEVTDAVNENSEAVDTYVEAAGKINGVDFSDAKTNTKRLGEAFENAQPTIQATGDDAQFVAEKIVEIPTETTIVLEIANYSTLITNLTTINTKFKDITNSVNALRLKISSELTTTMNTFRSRINGEFKTSLNSLSNQFTTAKNSVDDLQRSINKLSDKTISIKVKAGLTDGAKGFLKNLKDLDGSLKTQINKVLHSSQFASGGYPATGQMFIANERGPELVGKIGNRTAVANEEQIGDAIFRYMDEYGDGTGGGMNYDALASAMVSAMRSAGLGAVYLDGRMLAQSINRETARAGRPAITY